MKSTGEGSMRSQRTEQCGFMDYFCDWTRLVVGKCSFVKVIVCVTVQHTSVGLNLNDFRHV